MAENTTKINNKLSSLARRYSKALIKTAQEKNELDTVFNDLKLVDETYSNSSDMAEFLLHPVVTINDKKDVLKSVFDGKISNITLNFLFLLVDENKINLLPTIIYTYEEEYDEIKNIVKVEVISAIEIDEDLKTSLKAKLENKLQKEIKPEYKTDPSILAGLMLKFRDKIIDASLANKLKHFEKQLV
ncbi:MAG: ATP synthase F1 subunit delta [Candidatus Gastranaerophilales bacterium]|nr:ATP synthase F1 subunit delta [Candidatus Gastranaerophilales bacterium]